MTPSSEWAAEEEEEEEEEGRDDGLEPVDEGVVVVHFCCWAAKCGVHPLKAGSEGVTTCAGTGVAAGTSAVSVSVCVAGAVAVAVAVAVAWARLCRRRCCCATDRKGLAVLGTGITGIAVATTGGVLDRGTGREDLVAGGTDCFELLLSILLALAVLMAFDTAALAADFAMALTGSASASFCLLSTWMVLRRSIKSLTSIPCSASSSWMSGFDLALVSATAVFGLAAATGMGAPGFAASSCRIISALARLALMPFFFAKAWSSARFKVPRDESESADRRLIATASNNATRNITRCSGICSRAARCSCEN